MAHPVIELGTVRNLPLRGLLYTLIYSLKRKFGIYWGCLPICL